jgi:hypothetical protein
VLSFTEYGSFRSFYLRFEKGDFYTFRTLSTAVRLWARLCQIDDQLAGTLPAHAYAILLVFFLQNGSNPILPCIHDHIADKKSEIYESKKFVASVANSSLNILM